MLLRHHIGVGWETSRPDLGSHRITAALAELERSIIRERTRAGLASARARGRKGGRPRKLNDREWRAIRTLVDARELTIAEIAVQYGMSPATIYRRRFS